MDLLQIKYFQTVARMQHMTRAAGVLQIAQPALSAMIAKLEEDLGVPLFNRTGRNIVLNEYGKVFLKRADKILKEVEEGRQEISDLSGNEMGSVSIATTSLNKEFGKFLGSFSCLYPKVNFHITQSGDDREKLYLLEKDEIDFAFINTIDENTNFSTMKLAEEDIYLAVPPLHPLASYQTVSFKDLKDEAFIGLKANYSQQEFCNEICKKSGFVPNVICECSEYTAVINLVEAGLGVSFLPCSEKEEKKLPVVLLKIEGINFKNILQLVWKEQRYFSKAARNFREYVMQYFNITGNYSERAYQ
ncbi:LysR family transcriptional regulator [Anaerocolumna chitinilytica]|uniref:LysR family transcriptional regulator n=1 Tax=Anaerocolumna chitinilytica TaxID=1727145 RepID=A0A7I8DJ70_9FIRM|nr:LysR family transcriptional regulator [Anaerocolumna chitinilytica]BCJ98548.1 LysR family transcriptional regulator [Anaerocolumna chitinilytica]